MVHLSKYYFGIYYPSIRTKDIKKGTVHNLLKLFSLPFFPLASPLKSVWGKKTWEGSEERQKHCLKNLD